MALYEVALEDGRSVPVYADDEAAALKHAKFSESSRVSSERHAKIAGGRKNPDFAAPTKAKKIKG